MAAHRRAPAAVAYRRSCSHARPDLGSYQHREFGRAQSAGRRRIAEAASAVLRRSRARAAPRDRQHALNEIPNKAPGVRSRLGKITITEIAPRSNRALFFAIPIG